MAIPAAAAAAYRAASQMGTAAATSAITPANVPGGNFSDFLSGALKDSINTMRQGEHAASQQVQGKITDLQKQVVAAYQSIMNMPI